MQIVRYISDRCKQIAHERCSSADDREGYAEARRTLLIGKAVGARRLNLGLSHTELEPARPAYPSATGR